MPFIIETSVDLALNYIDDNCAALHICTQLPANYSEATTKDAYSCGYKADVHLIANPVSDGLGGRKVVVSAIVDGTVDCTGTVEAGFWAVVSATELLAAGSLAAVSEVVDTSIFTLSSFEIVMPVTEEV